MTVNISTVPSVSLSTPEKVGTAFKILNYVIRFELLMIQNDVQLYFTNQRLSVQIDNGQVM